MEEAATVVLDGGPASLELSVIVRGEGGCRERNG